MLHLHESTCIQIRSRHFKLILLGGGTGHGVCSRLPGVNGASATALKSISTDLATAEGFGKGEFSAWSNNLRALAGAAATASRCFFMPL